MTFRLLQQVVFIQRNRRHTVTKIPSKTFRRYNVCFILQASAYRVESVLTATAPRMLPSHLYLEDHLGKCSEFRKRLDSVIPYLNLWSRVQILSHLHRYSIGFSEHQKISIRIGPRRFDALPKHLRNVTDCMTKRFKMLFDYCAWWKIYTRLRPVPEMWQYLRDW